MNKYVLEPTQLNVENVMINDYLHRSEQLIKLAVFLNEQDDSTVIAIDGAWGSGKTFFVKQEKLLLDSVFHIGKDFSKSKNLKAIADIYENTLLKALPDGTLTNFISVYYDAWTHDDETDPLLSIIYSICEELSVQYLTKDYCPNIFKAASEVAKVKTAGVDIGRIVSELSKCDNWLKDQIEETDLKNKVASFFDTVNIELGDKIVIFIDELDRCNPTFAIRLLEKVKHYFNNPNVLFVFSINIDQLQHTIKRHYGNGFDSSRYLNRFFDIVFTLPDPDWSDYFNLLQMKYKGTDYTNWIASLVSSKYGLTLREFSRFLAMYKPLMDKYSSHGFESSTWFLSRTFLPVMIYLKLFDNDGYQSFINGNNDAPLLELFKDQEKTSLMRGLLSNGKWFVKKGEDIKQEDVDKAVSLTDLLDELYDYLFRNYDNNDRYSYIEMGNYIFYRDARNDLLNDISFFTL